MAISAIETSYRGYRFRSRLEARWGVALDHLGIRWEYEPQGYLVGSKQTPYLPDFWLPREQVWVEVKGSNDQLDISLMVDAARPQDGLPATGNVQSGHDVRLLILGPIAGMTSLRDESSGYTGYSGPTHTVLTCREDSVYQSAAYFTADGLEVVPGDGLIAGSDGLIRWDAREHEWGNLVGAGCYISADGAEPDMRVAGAFRAAMSARFEHGETPEMPR